jgi:hypothetical protein
MGGKVEGRIRVDGHDHKSMIYVFMGIPLICTTNSGKNNNKLKNSLSLSLSLSLFLCVCSLEGSGEMQYFISVFKLI